MADCSTGNHFSCKKYTLYRTRTKPFLTHAFTDVVQTWQGMMADICTSFYFQDQIQDGRLVAILLLKCLPNHFSDMHDPILFELGTSTVHDGKHVPLTLFCDLLKDGRLVDWRPF